MLILVQIDLSHADVPMFDDYENKVLALLGKYGARLEERLRAADGSGEVHLLHFPHAEALDAFRSDPVRVALQDMWTQSGAIAVLTQVVRVE